MAVETLCIVSLLMIVLHGIGLSSGRRPSRLPRETLLVYRMLTASIAIFVITSIAVLPPALLGIMALVGGASCGFSWLFARSLFNDAETALPRWCWLVVATIFGSHALVDLFSLFPSVVGEGAVRIALNVNALAGSAAMLLALFEPFHRFADTRPEERRFRVLFAGAYALLMGTAVLWVNGADSASVAATYAQDIRMTCALLALTLCAVGAEHRARYPLTWNTEKSSCRTPAQEDVELGQRVLRLLRDEQAYAHPELKVGDVATRLDSPDYRVTRAITGALGYRNFNQLVNHLRIERAKELLLDPAHRKTPILTIALTSGFNSLGPFNRAFKARCDTTPSAFRRNQPSAEMATGHVFSR